MSVAQEDVERCPDFLQRYNRNPKLLKEYYYVIELAQDAIIKDDVFIKLKKVAQNAKSNLWKIAEALKNKLEVKFNPIQQAGFEYILKSMNFSHLLYKEFSNISLDKFIY